MCDNRVPKPPGKSCNCLVKFPGPGNSWEMILVLENPEICWTRMQCSSVLHLSITVRLYIYTLLGTTTGSWKILWGPEEVLEFSLGKTLGAV